MDKIIDGKTLAKKHEELLKEKISKLEGRKPSMVSFCNSDDPSSVKYTEMKKQKASDLGIDFIIENYSSESQKEDLIEKVNKYNSDLSIDGIMIQLPLPEKLTPFKGELLGLIDKEKDIDGLNNGNFLSATVKGVLSILDSLRDPFPLGIGSLKYAVVGSTGEVGGDMVKALKEKNIEPLEINRTADNFNELIKADIIISATGVNGLIKPEMIKDNVVLIDIGLGDFEESCFEKASFYTPKIGGVGPMTVISLMENVVESYLDS